MINRAAPFPNTPAVLPPNPTNQIHLRPPKPTPQYPPCSSHPVPHRAGDLCTASRIEELGGQGHHMAIRQHTVTMLIHRPSLILPPPQTQDLRIHALLSHSSVAVQHDVLDFRMLYTLSPPSYQCNWATRMEH